MMFDVAMWRFRRWSDGHLMVQNAPRSPSSERGGHRHRALLRRPRTGLRGHPGEVGHSPHGLERWQRWNGA